MCLFCRILIWYIIVTALFRCPSSLDGLTQDSSIVCKPYLHFRAQAAPYVEPYYESYAAPYVDKARPYVDSFNTQVYTPSVDYGKQSYQKYGAPKVDEARKWSLDRWEEAIKPRMDALQLQMQQQYETNLAPYVSKVSSATAPIFTNSRNSASQIYSERMLPAYEATRPYAEQTYALGHKFTIETGLPYASSAWSSTTIFLDRVLWPKLRILYGENVEPQLVRIGERLGRYRDGKRLKAVMEDVETSTTASLASSSISSVSSSLVPDSLSATSVTTTNVESTASPSLTAEQEAERTREKIESDLQNWEDRFAKAADKGIEDLEERVKEITDRQIESQVHGVGEALVIQLEEASSSEIAKLKSEIHHLVKKFPEEYDEDDLGKATLSLSRSTRFAGMAVKDKAQAIRSWKEKFDQETRALVSAASASTLDVIDNIRDLGLQEIGLRWAQMEGVTYKDWSRYNEVKKTFDEWRSKIQAVALGHEGLQASKETSEELESRGMGLAEETAKELARLKEVGNWKLEAGDITDDFSTRYIPAKAAAGARKVMDKASSASEQVQGTPQGTFESVTSDAAEQAFDAASSVSSAVAGTKSGAAEDGSSQASAAASRVSEELQKVSDKVVSETASESSTPASDSPSSLVSSASSSASSIASQASRKVYGGAMAQKVGDQKPILDDVISDDDDATYSEKMQSMVNQAGDKYADITQAVSDALLKATSTQGTVESASSVAEEQYSKALAAASSVLYGTQTGTVERATSVAAGKYAEAVAA